MSEIQQHTATSQQQPRHWRLLSLCALFDKTFRNVWFYIAAVSLVVNMVYAFRPQPTVQSGAALVDSNPLTTLFTVSNNGAFTLYNVRIQCEIFDGDIPRGTFSRMPVPPEGNAPVTGSIDVDELTPTDTATRDCGFKDDNATLKGLNPKTTRINIIISYDYFWGAKSFISSHHFNTRVIGTRVILVPDVEPKKPFRPRV
jgi:hypothetical protein